MGWVMAVASIDYGWAVQLADLQNSSNRLDDGLYEANMLNSFNRSSNRMFNRFDNRLCRVNGILVNKHEK